ncbi:MAG: hypothetical protein RRZ24_07470 [Clostridia bacterium]
MMTKDAYPALFHEIHKAVSSVRYPATKADVLALVRDTEVHVDWDQTVPLSSFIQSIQKSAFSCAADFYCALIAALG